MGAALNKGRIAALRLTHWLALLCALVAGTTAFAKEDFLPPDQAYRYAVRSEADRIVVTWTIAPGYYLYKNRMAVSSGLPEFPLGEPSWPRGEDHEDEYFGRQEIYRGTIDVAVPLPANAQRPQSLPLELRLQGCADAGLCYPPLTWKTQVTLAQSNNGTAGAARSLLASSSRRSNQQDFLPPDEAFRFGASMLGPDTVALTWIIAEDYYLYKDRIQVATTNTNVQLGSLVLPEGKHKQDEFFGDVAV
jgi:thiol:disulfide interchange protein DsbD